MRKIGLMAVTAMTVFTMMTGCNGNSSTGTTQSETQETTEQATQAKEVSLDEIHEAVKEAYGEDYIPSMPFEEQMMEDVFGIKKELYENYIAEGPMISIHIDNFVAIQAKEGKGSEVQGIMEDYRQYLVSESLQYPMNMPKVEASEVIRHGDYVFFLMLGTPSDESASLGEEEALASAKEVNQIGVDIVNSFFQ